MDNQIHIRRLKNGRLQPVHIPYVTAPTARLPKKFFMVKRLDTATSFVDALLHAGYLEVPTAKQADFILYDKESSSIARQAKIESQAVDKPIFIYPHTPYSFWFWDGYVKPRRCTCNFVVGDTAVKSMQVYGYPYRVEAVGFPRCEVKPFHPTAGKHLVYSSNRLQGKSGKMYGNERNASIQVMRWLMQNKKFFDLITIYYQFSVQKNGMASFVEDGFVYKPAGGQIEMGVSNTLRQLESADIVISCNTFAYISIAQGCPTMIYPTKGIVANKLVHFDSYRQWFDFPLDLFSMDGADVLALRDKPNPQVEEWKRMNIGTSFDAEKFISVVREFV